MTELKNRIKEDLKNAMREKNDAAKNTLKAVLSEFMNELVATKRTPQDELSEEEQIKVLKKLQKQRKDSIQKFSDGGRDDLVENEKKELAVIEKYLPELMTKEDILKIASSKKDELNIVDKAKMGVLIGAVMRETGGNADGGDVKEVVESLFQ